MAVVEMEAFDDELTTASLVAKRILPEMARWKVPVTPENYHVWFVDSLGTNAELTAALGQIKDSEATFTRETNQYIYNKYFGNERNEEPQKQLFKEMQSILQGTLGEIMVAGDAASGYGKKLKEYTDKLNGAKGLSETRLVMERVLKDTLRMSGATQALQDKLDEATSRAENLQQQLELTTREALKDPLTGLHNRKALELKIGELYRAFKENATGFAVMMLDIDFFKQFNDQYGHKIGDEVLRLVGTILVECLKGRDYPARYGGEEFIVLLPDTGAKGADAVAEQIRRCLAGKKLKVVRTGERLRVVTVSIGVSAIDSKDTVDSVLERADRALYLAKNSGRNCVRSQRDLPPRTSSLFSESTEANLPTAIE